MILSDKLCVFSQSLGKTKGKTHCKCNKNYLCFIICIYMQHFCILRKSNNVKENKLNPLLDLPVNCIDREDHLASLRDHIVFKSAGGGNQPFPVYVVCRRGNDSQIAVQKLKNHIKSESIKFKDISGGLHAWAKHIDTEFPVY